MASSSEQRLQRSQAHHVVDEHRDQFALFRVVQANFVFVRDLDDDLADLAGQLGAGQLGGRRGVDLIHQDREDDVLRFLDGGSRLGAGGRLLIVRNVQPVGRLRGTIGGVLAGIRGRLSGRGGRLSGGTVAVRRGSGRRLLRAHVGTDDVLDQHVHQIPSLEQI